MALLNRLCLITVATEDNQDPAPPLLRGLTPRAVSRAASGCRPPPTSPALQPTRTGHVRGRAGLGRGQLGPGGRQVQPGGFVKRYGHRAPPQGMHAWLAGLEGALRIQAGGQAAG